MCTVHVTMWCKPSPGIQGQEESEARVRLNDSGLSVDGATLVEVELTPGLQQRVQAIQHGRVAQVGAVQQYPPPCLDGSGQSPVHPLKSAASINA